MPERVQKLMSQAGYGSRRESEAIIAAGRVEINGRTARLGDKADPANDDIRVDGNKLRFGERIYIKLYKPKGVISSTEDEMEMGRKTVRDLIGIPGFIYPVGRLDKQSEGLMILTNDGKLTHRLTHPSYSHRKVYDVDVKGDISNDMLALWRAGVRVDGKITAPADIVVLDRSKKFTRLRITLTEGRKRQIRRIAASLGHPVTRLLRIEIGPIKLGWLKPGEWTYMTTDELTTLKNEVFSGK